MADNHNEDEHQTVVEALGLTKEWADKNVDVLNESFEIQGTISELLMNLGLSVKNDEFGKLKGEAGNLGEYELKLLYSGYQVARFMEKQGLKMFKSGLGNPFGNSGHPFLDMLKGLSGDGIRGGAIRVRMDENGNIEGVGADDAPEPIKDIIKDIIKGIKKRDSKNTDNDE